MFRRIALLLLALLPTLLSAQVNPRADHMRISLLTVSVGDEIYAAFGHTGIRIIDSVNHSDIVYNYGTFDGFDENFELKFARGKLLYSISSESFQHFMETYVYEQRTVQENELRLDLKQKSDILVFLETNMEPDNRHYKYDFFYDNCATRIRDIFPNELGTGFKFGQTIPVNSKVTFRQQINYYLRGQHWERFGINLCLGSRIDKVMSNTDVMFLPDYLRDGLANATLNGQKISSPPVTLLSEPGLPVPGMNMPFIVILAAGVVTILTLIMPSLKPLGRVISSLVLIITGLLGCFLLVMWFGTDHQACRYNWNVLWALPTNIFVPFLRKNGRGKYALIAIMLIFVTLLLHVTGLQQIALFELWPLLLALLFIFGMIYRQSKVIIKTNEAG